MLSANKEEKNGEETMEEKKVGSTTLPGCGNGIVRKW